MTLLGRDTIVINRYAPQYKKNALSFCRVIVGVYRCYLEL
jgi:hypothetical protein